MGWYFSIITENVQDFPNCFFVIEGSGATRAALTPSFVKEFKITLYSPRLVTGPTFGQTPDTPLKNRHITWQ